MKMKMTTTQPPSRIAVRNKNNNYPLASSQSIQQQPSSSRRSSSTRRLLFFALLASLTLPVASQNITDSPTFAPAAVVDTSVPSLTPSAAPVVATTTATPTAAPVVATLPTFPACSLCPLAAQAITNLPGRYNERTCEAWSTDGAAGLLSPAQCTTLQDSVAFQAVCDCAFDATAVPTAFPTLAPTVAPTSVITLETAVVMVLSNVTVAMSPVHRNYFGPQLALYLEQELRKTTSLGAGWTGQLESQLLLDGVPSGAVRRRSLLLRADQTARDLQITVSSPLATRTVIQAKQNADVPPLNVEQLDFFIRDVLAADGGAGFLAQLLNTSSPTLVVYFEKIQGITLFPSDSEITQGPGRQDGLDNDDDDDGDDDGFFTLWAIVGIAGGIGFCLLVVALVLLCVMQPETILNSPRGAGSPRGGGFSTSPTKAASSKVATNGKKSDAAEDDNTYYGNASVLNPPTVNPHDDNQSYAYSLEPGNFDNATVVGGGQQPPSWKTSLNAPSLAPDDSRSIYTTRRGPMVLRDIQAPPGKLGIVIDTSLEGPVVHKVNENSPLLGKIFAGDIITNINGIDTRAMKASVITGIMVRTAHEPRALTVAAEDTMK